MEVRLNQTTIFLKGAATVAVIAGQVYIGIGYRIMTQSIIDLTEVFTIIQESEELKRYPNFY